MNYNIIMPDGSKRNVDHQQFKINETQAISCIAIPDELAHRYEPEPQQHPDYTYQTLGFLYHKDAMIGTIMEKVIYNSLCASQWDWEKNKNIYIILISKR